MAFYFVSDIEKGKVMFIFQRFAKVTLLLLFVLLVSDLCCKNIDTKRDETGYPAPGKLVDIGGYKLHINSTGEGAPTVILDSALGWSSLSWSLVQPEVEKFVRVCSYDRAGLGWSDEGPRERTSENFVYELHELLQKQNVPKPYILVGHSSGGLNMRLYTSTHPEDVFGVILVESSHEDQFQVLKDIEKHFPIKRTFAQRIKEGLLNSKLGNAFTEWLRSHHLISSDKKSHLPGAIQDAINALGNTPKSHRACGGERKHFELSMRQVKNSKNQLIDKPLIVITRGGKLEEFFPPSHKMRMRAYDKVWSIFQSDFVSKSNKSKQVFAMNSGHMVVFDQPEIIVGAIRSMVDQYRNECKN